MPTDRLLPLPSLARPYIPPGWHPLGWWSVTTLCGLGAGLLTFFSIIPRSNVYGILVGVVVSGVAVGAMELPFLPAPGSRRAGARWVLASGLGWVVAIGVTVGIALWDDARVLRAATPHAITMRWLLGPVGGGILGLSQWLVLRRSVRHAIWWLPATVISASSLWGMVALLDVVVRSGTSD